MKFQTVHPIVSKQQYKKYPETLPIFLYLESRILQSSSKGRCFKARVNILFGL